MLFCYKGIRYVWRLRTACQSDSLPFASPNALVSFRALFVALFAHSIPTRAIPASLSLKGSFFFAHGIGLDY